MNVLENCTFMKIQVAFRRVPTPGFLLLCLHCPFPLGPNRFSYSHTWLHFATQFFSLSTELVRRHNHSGIFATHSYILPHISSLCLQNWFVDIIILANLPHMAKNLPHIKHFCLVYCFSCLLTHGKNLPHISSLCLQYGL